MLPLLADRPELFRTLAEDIHGPSVSELLHRFYFDLAGTPTQSQITALSTITTHEHLLYGSDYVWTRRPHVLHALTTLDTAWPGTDPTWRQLTTRNAHQLLGTTPVPNEQPRVKPDRAVDRKHRQRQRASGFGRLGPVRQILPDRTVVVAISV